MGEFSTISNHLDLNGFGCCARRSTPTQRTFQHDPLGSWRIDFPTPVHPIRIDFAVLCGRHQPFWRRFLEVGRSLGWGTRSGVCAGNDE